MHHGWANKYEVLPPVVVTGCYALVNFSPHQLLQAYDGEVLALTYCLYHCLYTITIYTYHYANAKQYYTISQTEILNCNYQNCKLRWSCKKGDWGLHFLLELPCGQRQRPLLNSSSLGIIHNPLVSSTLATINRGRL
jgi:hypothetical protein